MGMDINSQIHALAEERQDHLLKMSHRPDVARAERVAYLTKQLNGHADDIDGPPELFGRLSELVTLTDDPVYEEVRQRMDYARDGGLYADKRAARAVEEASKERGAMSGLRSEGRVRRPRAA